MAADEYAGTDVLLATALAQAVKEVGRSLAKEPRRVQGMVSDVLGAESRSRRAEIDAVVLAAEEGIPDDLLAGRTDLTGAMATLRGRGLDENVSAFAIEVWRYALGMLGTDAEPPSLTNSLQRLQISDTDQISEPSPAPTTTPAATAPVTVIEFAPPRVSEAEQLPPPAPPVPPEQRSSAGARGPLRWLWVLIPVVLAIVVGGVVVVAAQGDDPKATPEEEVSTTSEPEETTTTVQATTTTVAAAPTAVFDVEQTPLGPLTRTWTIEDGELVGELSFENTTAGELSGMYYEVVPKAVVADAAAITAEPPFTVFRADPIVFWDLKIPAGETVVVTYRTAVTGDIADTMLAEWKAQQLTDAAAFVAERAAPPALAVATSSDTVVNVPEADITGSTDPSATVTVNDVAATVNPDGSWTAHVTGLVDGTNILRTVAKSQWGVTAMLDSNINLIRDPGIAPVDPGTGTTTKPPRGGGTPPSGGGTPPPGGGGTPDTTTTTATPTQPEPPDTTTTSTTAAPAPRPTVSVSGPSSVTACRPISFTATVTNASSGSWTSSWGATYSGGLTWNVTMADIPGGASVTYHANGPGGQVSGTKSFTVTADPTTPGADC